MTTTVIVIAVITAFALGVCFRVRHIERVAGAESEPRRTVTHLRWPLLTTRELASPAGLTPSPHTRASCPHGYVADDCCRSCGIEPGRAGGV